MSQLQITNAGIDYRNAVFAGDEVQNITHFVFANIADQDASVPIDPNVTIPQTLAHTQPVKAVSKVDGNAIVMSAVLGYDTGDFEYNWYGVVATKANNEQVLIAVVTTETQTKIKTNGAVTGNYSVKSIVWRSQNIAEQLNITLAVLPWQVQDTELVSRADFDAHHHDNAYVKKEQVLTNVPEGAVFTDTQRPLSSSIGSVSQLTAATSLAAKTAYDRGTAGINAANAVQNSLNEKVKTNVPAGAVFTDTNTWRAVADNLTSTASDKSLSANQGRVLKGLIDNINALLMSDDATLDDIQEIVDYIKQNKSTLESLSISNIAGLQNALDGKVANSRVLTDVPANAKFTDTQRPLSNSVSSTSSTTAATSAAAKTAYDRGTAGINAANAVQDSLNDKVKTNVPAGAVFTDTQRPLSSSISSSSTTTAATSAAAKTAYDRGTAGINAANAVQNSLNEKVKTNVPAGAVFTDTNTWRDVVNSLTSTASDKSLSANQGRVLKGLIDNINALLTSDDTTLNEIQEIVDYIKLNKSTLESLSISSIAGLQNALNGKVSNSRVLTDVPVNAKFTDTQRPLSSSVTSTSTTTAATSAAAKTAYDRGTAGINAANQVGDRLDDLLNERPFTRSQDITLYRRHSLNAGEHTAPTSRVGGSALQDQDWFSIRASNGEPSIVAENGSPIKFKRLLDGEVDTQVTIVADDKNERVFVFNKTDNVWEF